jgi:hypothetical protein
MDVLCGFSKMFQNVGIIGDLEHTYEIIHLEHTYETQGVELEDRAKMIANLEQQLLELQGQAPPEPIDHQEIDAMSGMDED